jgi:hypothetical protein
MPSEMSFPLTGGCGCGAVRFQVTAPPVAAVYCHCTRCQRRSGAGAPASARLQPGTLEVLTGAEHIRTWAPDGGFEKDFCDTCGSALFARHPEDPDVVAVRMGAFDADPGVRPSARQFTAYAVAWEPIPDDGLPRFPERVPD